MVQTTITSGAIAKHQVISRAGRPRCIKSRPLPCQSHRIYAHNKKNQHNGIRLPKLFTVHLDADMLDKHMLLFKFLACDLRGKIKNNILRQPVSQIPYRLYSKPFKVQQPCPPLSYLSSWCAAKPLMLQSYKSTHLRLYWTITCTSHLTFFALSVKSVLR